MPIAVRSYILPPTPQIPNSPHPPHYPGLLKETVTSPTFTPTHLLDLYAKNGWQTQWIAKYGPDIQSHYHSTTHEAMTVISGAGAIIRFGVADAPDWQPGMYAPGERGENAEPGGLDIEASIGDDVTDEVERERRTFFDQVAIKGEFMMMGAYPYGNVWDFKIGGERGREQVWGVPLPELDPILGGSDEGLVGLWH
ncbi:hypothetical protein J3E71DRAFT_380444 [Bipolaris maydis]|nr:hypothetical protein J3E71DRAFT_380444 [Bipolaris maydis]